MEGSPGSKALSNPFPGLRPFEADEEHLFFGREKEVDELLRRLRTTRFLLVVGSSGTGKSSLVRSGLIPALESGFMLGAGSTWRTIVSRPGDNPIGNLAAAMDAPGALGTNGELASTNRVLLEATLDRSSLGIVQAVRQARIPAEDNVLLVVDQFEELFRFRRSSRSSRDESVAFFKLLLEATRQHDVPIYIALTMRSDFLGDCIEFQGLPEAVNDGLYLIPRMTRDELRSAITGPVAVAGGEITQRLVLRLLNDLGDDQDQLPVLQHALMRTWNRWEALRAEEQSIDISDYEAIGGLQKALSLHAEEAFEEAGSVVRGQQIAERAFKALTDTYSDPRGVRRATSIQELAAVCELPEVDVMQVVEIFRRRGRSFLTPHASVPLESRTIVDLSHESLMRCWTRLVGWTREERDSARSYMRIAQAASWWSEGSGNLWSDPQLETALQWRQKSHPTAAWAERYDTHFTLAMEFLDRSAERREAERKKEISRKRLSLIAIWVLSVLFVAVGLLAWFAIRQRTRAERNLDTAIKAVDDSLASAAPQDSGGAREVPESPDVGELRHQLACKARGYYLQLTKQKGGNEALDTRTAKVVASLGDADRLLGMWRDAVDEYKQAIALYEQLAKKYPGQLTYKEQLGYCHMWLGETLRLWLAGTAKPAQYSVADAETQFDQAITVQKQLQQSAPGNRVYPQELARSYYNRGILLNDSGGNPLVDFQRALTLLRSSPGGPSVASPVASGPDPAQDLARVENNLGVVYLDRGQYADAAAMFQNAALSLAPSRQHDPGNREYKLEGAYYYLNLADALYCDNQDAAARKATAAARALADDLAAGPVESLREQITKMEQALTSP
jgi:tetratricopeptide (TPR) repeat protein